MQYKELVELYEKLYGTTKKLEKVELLAEFLVKLREEGRSEWIYLLRGKVVPDYDSREFGISRQLVIKAMHKTYGLSDSEIVKKLNQSGDLGELTEKLARSGKQSSLFSKKLSVEHVFNILQKLLDIEGKGSVDIKLSYISELLLNATPSEAKYIMRTLLGDLRIGVADALLRDSLIKAFLSDSEQEVADKLEESFDLVNDSAVVFEAASKGKKALEKLKLIPGKPTKVMLPVKVASVEEGFKVCGKPAAFEHKYDGFRVLINKNKNNVTLFTRKLENVTNQFPDVVKAVLEQIDGDSFILDSEVVGYDSKTGNYMPFEAISQRIRRKYDIEEIIKKLPVEINAFDILYYNGESVIELSFKERRKILEKIVNVKKRVIRTSFLFVSNDLKKVEKFYEDALKNGEEGIMIKNLEAPYKQGRRVGYMAKLKPVMADLDLVIVGAEYGTGKRGGWLTSYIVACKDENDYLEIGKVSSGLKEKEEEGMTYDKMTELLNPLIISSEGNYVSLKPKVVVAVTYQNVQKSPSYSSGLALRFPRISAYRPDKPVSEISTLKDIEDETK